MFLSMLASSVPDGNHDESSGLPELDPIVSASPVSAGDGHERMLMNLLQVMQCNQETLVEMASEECREPTPSR